MKPRLLFILLCLSCAAPSYAQLSNMVFIGTATVEGGESYSYKLQLTDSNNVITGYSVTDLMGPNETKTQVRGTINESKKQITFRETKVLYTKVKGEEQQFCYFRGHLKLSKIHGTTALKGSFEGFHSDGKTSCGSGKLTLVCAQDIMDKLLKNTKKETPAIPETDTVVTPTPAKTVEVVYEKDVPDASVLKVLPGKTIELSCASPAVSFEVWDSKTIDGDIITLLQDGKTILENYTISGRHKSLGIDMRGNKTVTLTLIAVNEGSEPLNTARIKITSGSDVYYVDASTTMDKHVTIILERK